MNITNQLIDLDVRLLYWSEHQRQKNSLLNAAKRVSRSGDGYVQVAVVVFFALSASADSRQFALWLGAIIGVERLLYWVLKNTLKRKRPPIALPAFKAEITASDQFSFPSGHTSAAFLVVGALAVQGSVMVWLALPWAGAIGASRVLLGVHFPSDIIAGASLGLLVVYIGAGLL